MLHNQAVVAAILRGMVCCMQVWVRALAVQHSSGLTTPFNTMLHIHPMGGVFYLPQHGHRVQGTSNLTSHAIECPGQGSNPGSGTFSRAMPLGHTAACLEVNFQRLIICHFYRCIPRFSSVLLNSRQFMKVYMTSVSCDRLPGPGIEPGSRGHLAACLEVNF